MQALLTMEESNKFLIYTDGSGLTKIDVKLEENTLWLTHAQMCELYQTSKSNVSEHIKHIFEEGELQEEAVVRKFRTTAADGKSYWENMFAFGELKPIMVFKDQVNVPLNFDGHGKPRKDKIESLIKEIELGLWDTYLMWNYEAYQNARSQLQFGQMLTSLPLNMQMPTSNVQTDPVKNSDNRRTKRKS